MHKIFLQNNKVSKIFTASCILAICILPLIAFAQMESSSYKIPSDSINVGGARSTSTNYAEIDTIGEQGTGVSTSTNYVLSAGFLHMQETYLSITAAADVTLPSINGLTGGISTSSTAWTVATDNMAGYSMTIQASTQPALKSPSGASFANYAPSGSADFSFSIPTSASAFGFSPEGTDITSTYKDNGSACSTGSSDTADKCWNGFSTSAQTIVQRATSNHPSGTVTTLKLRAESGSTHIQDTGTYTATLTVTAMQL